jgi:ATP-dependent DNA helicase RecG
METEAGPVVLTEIARAIQHPVRFAGREYIRVGSYKKNLKDYPEKDSPTFRHPWPQCFHGLTTAG